MYRLVITPPPPKDRDRPGRRSRPYRRIDRGSARNATDNRLDRQALRPGKASESRSISEGLDFSSETRVRITSYSVLALHAERGALDGDGGADQVFVDCVCGNLRGVEGCHGTAA